MNLDLIKRLRERTGAGVSECSKVLKESGGDFEKAVALLRERGKVRAAKRQTREARKGIIASYVHATGRIGVLLELRSESDFVARTDDFKKLAQELCLQIAAMKPRELAEKHDDDALPLLEQPYIRDENRKVGELIAEYSSKFGEKIEVARFVRFEL